MKKSRITYELILFGSLFFVYYHGGVVPWTLFYFVLFLPVISLIHLIVTYYSFRWKEAINQGQYYKGETIEYKWKVENDIHLPYPYIEMFIYTPDMFLMGKQEKITLSYLQAYDSYVSYKTKCRYRGRYSIGITKIIFYDFLFLFKLTHNNNQLSSILVYPQIKKLLDYPGESRAFSDVKVSFYNRHRGDESLLNVREYVVGDSPKAIHWKLTSKLDKVMVIDKETTLDNHVVIILDLKRQSMSYERRIIYEDTIIEKAVSLAHHFLTRNIPVDLLYNHEGSRLWHGYTSYDFDDVFKILAEIPFDETIGVENSMDIVFESEYTNNAVYVLSIDVNKDLYRSILKLNTTGHFVSLYYCNPDTRSMDDNFKEVLMKYGIRSQRLEPGDD
ncbi:MAG: DUF58 domain-containing protein [Clostridia bacterium]